MIVVLLVVVWSKRDATDVVLTKADERVDDVDAVHKNICRKGARFISCGWR